MPRFARCCPALAAGLAVRGGLVAAVRHRVNVRPLRGALAHRLPLKPGKTAVRALCDWLRVRFRGLLARLCCRML